MKGLTARVLLLLLLIGGLVSSAAAKEEWIQVRSKNFLLIGNASEKDVRNVAERLERFRLALRKLFNNAELSSPIATNVVVFRNADTYLPYQPLRRDGKVDRTVQGYFQSGTDVNYITVTIGTGEEQTYRTIFHEYVHFAISTIYPKAEVPTWFNEGLAEYYSTFALRNDRTGDIGEPIKDHVKLLEKNTLLPLDTLFPLRGSDVNNSSVYSRLLFYAESWAFVHYLIETGRTAELTNFIADVLNGVPLGQSFKSAFRQDYRSMETAFKAYIARKSYGVSQIDLGDPASTDTDVRASTLSQSYTNAYLGDLLYHLDRHAEAEAPLLAALKDDPANDIANADLGMMRFQQQKFDEARKYLEIAASGEQTSAPILYQYAYVLSREGFDGSGNSIEYEPATVTKMRTALRRAMTIGPALTESYDLLAVIDLAENEDLDEAANAMQAALHYEPGRNDFALRLADVYVRQKKYGPARELADRVSQYAAPDLKLRANAILNYIRDQEAKKMAGLNEQGEMAPLGPRTDPPMTRAEVKEADALSTLRSINADLRSVKAGENRVVGTIERIDCSDGKVKFAVRSAGRDLALASADFQNLTLRTFDKDAARSQIGCDAQVKMRTAVITYKEPGELVAIEFVPSNFRLLTPDEIKPSRAHLVRQDQVDSQGYSLKDPAAPANDRNVQPDADALRIDILKALGATADGEKRDIGYIEAIGCGTGFYLLIRTSAGTLRLQSTSPHSMHLASFVAEIPPADLTCTSKLMDYPLVVTYKQTAAGSGTITSLAIVPRDFKLD
jgi:tetratricopeptide (TPR) repeat protein